jgi:hypothetical protein
MRSTKPGLTGWVLLNASFAAKQYRMYGYLSDSMVFLVAGYRHCVEYKNGTHTISPNVNINPSPSVLKSIIPTIGLTGWVLLNASFAAKQYRMYGYLSDSMVFLVAVHKNGTHTISPNVNINPSPSVLKSIIPTIPSSAYCPGCGNHLRCGGIHFPG